MFVLHLCWVSLVESGAIHSCHVCVFCTVSLKICWPCVHADRCPVSSWILVAWMWHVITWLCYICTDWIAALYSESKLILLQCQIILYSIWGEPWAQPLPNCSRGHIVHFWDWLKPTKLLATNRPSFKCVLLKNHLIPDVSTVKSRQKQVVNTDHMCHE